MKARYAIAIALAATGVAFLVGAATTPVGDALPAAVATVAPTAPAVAGRTSTRAAGRRPLSTVRRFTPPPMPADDPGVAEIVNGPDEPAADVIAARWQDIDRRLEELFGVLPAEKLGAIRTAMTSWIRDHGRVVRAYYRGNIDQAELTDNIHANLLGYARSIEAAMTRDEYRTFMNLEPGDDPFIVLVPPGVTVGQSMNPPADPSSNLGGGHSEDPGTPVEYGDPDHKATP
jgi:hypothetical protein